MRFRRGYEDTRGAKVQGVKCRGACIVERHHIDVLLMGYTNRATSIIYSHNLLITQSYSPIEAGGCSLQFLPSDTICERSLSGESGRTCAHLRSLIIRRRTLCP